MKLQEAEKLYKSLFDYFKGVIREDGSSYHVCDNGFPYFYFPNVHVCLYFFEYTNQEYLVYLQFAPDDLDVPSVSYKYRSIKSFNYDNFVDDLNFFHLPWVSRIGLLGDLAK